MSATRILVGDARTELATLDAGSVQCCITSPPYWGLRDYGTEPLVFGGLPDCAHAWGAEGSRHRGGPNGSAVMATRDQSAREAVNHVGTGAFCVCGAWRGHLGLEPTPALYVEHMVDVFAAVRRVLADDGVLWLNIGDSYATGAGKVGEHPGGGEQGARWRGEGSKHGVRKGSNRAQRGDGNGGAPYGPMTQPNRMPIVGLKPKDLIGIPWRVALALQADGWWLRSDVIWSKPNPMPESVTDRPTKSHEYLFLLATSESYYYNHAAIREPFADGRMGRDYPQPNAPDKIKSPHGQGFTRRASERNRGGRSDGFTKPNDIDPSENGGRNKRSVWTVATAPFAGAHFATFPPALVEPCILAGSRPGDTVLDPFFGAGTTGLVAQRHGRDCIGIELNPAYAEIARERITNDSPLFAQVTA